MTIQATPITDRFGRTLAPLTSDQLKVFQRVIEDVGNTRRNVLTLDMRTDEHRNFVIDRLGGDDYLSQYFPATRDVVHATHAAHIASNGPQKRTLLEMDAPSTTDWSPLVYITYLGVDNDDATVVAQGIVSLPYPAAITLNLILADKTSGQTLANITLPTQFNTTTQSIEATGTAPGQDMSNVVASLTASYLVNGSTEGQQVVATSLLAGAMVVQSMNVVNPNHGNHPQTPYIKVALNRTPQQQADCDYYYTTGMSGPEPIVGLQVNGSALLINGFTIPPSPNFSGTCLLIRRAGYGAGAVLAFPEDQIPGLCQGAGNALTWNIGTSWFNGAPWNQNEMIDLNFLLNFVVSPGGPASLMVTSTPAGMMTVPANIGVIEPIQFVWGCVAKGTAVRMADGSLRAIETLLIGERVAGSAGSSMRIAQVWTGYEDQPLYQLTTAHGGRVLLTDEHPVPTSDGVYLARDLEAGMRVFTHWGEETLQAVDCLAYQGEVINLDLLPDGYETLDQVPEDALTAFEAGGIQVGDNRMQGIHSQRARTQHLSNLEIPLDHSWHLDITNSRRANAGLPLIQSRAS